jgi:hypothetical protein
VSTATDRRETYEHVLGIVEHNTGGKQRPTAAWTSVVQIALANGNDHDQVSTAIRAAVENDDLLSWNGRLARTDRESLVAVIEAERERESTRTNLIARCNRLMEQP